MPFQSNPGKGGAMQSDGFIFELVSGETRTSLRHCLSCKLETIKMNSQMLFIDEKSHFLLLENNKIPDVVSE